MATMMTAFSMVMLVPIAGLALDGGLAYIVKARLSAAADSAALAAARGLSGGSTVSAAQAQATALATTFFNGNFPSAYLNTDTAGRAINAVFTLGTGTGTSGNGIANGILQVQVTASVRSATYFMKWLGYAYLPINTTGTATRRQLVMTLVLDKSASMGTRTTTVGSLNPGLGSTSCDAMVSSAIQFLNNFSPYDYIGVLPFDYTAYNTYPPTTSYAAGNAAAQVIANINCGNNTNTTAALNLAFQQIQTVNLPLANNVIVLFTDGVPNGVNATFPIRTQADTRLASSCGGGECAVPVCTTATGSVSGVIAQAAGFNVKPYQTAVPSFGVWGYALAKLQPFDAPAKLSENIELKFLNEKTLAAMFEFSADTDLPNEEIEINRLDNQSLVRYYEAEWRRFE